VQLFLDNDTRSPIILDSEFNVARKIGNTQRYATEVVFFGFGDTRTTGLARERSFSMSSNWGSAQNDHPSLEHRRRLLLFPFICTRAIAGRALP
jgi:hypothetical protein